MAKNDGDLFDTYGISKMLEMINNNFQQNNSLANNEFAQQLLDRMEKLVGTQSKLTAKDIEKVFKDIFTPFLKNVYGGNAELTNALKILKSEIKNLSSRQDVSTKLMANMLTGGTSLMYSTSVAAIRSGSGNKPFNIGKEKDPEAAAKMDKIFGEQQKTSSAVSDFQDKLMSFLNMEKGQEKTKKRQFIEDLAEGLGRSKFIGGAIIDLIRLASFFAANWLKNFGPIGKALAVGVVALAPVIGTVIANILTKSLVNGLTSVIKNSLLGLGTLLKTTLASFVNRNAVANVVGGPARANLATGALLGAGIVGGLAIDSFKKGGARENTAGGFLAAGAVGLLITGLAAAFGVALSPIILPVTAIATGIGLIVKFWPQITSAFQKILEWLGIIAKKDEDGNYIGGARTIIDKVTGYGGQSERAKLTKGVHSRAWDEANTAAIKVSDTGVITNMGALTQENLSKQIAEYTGNDLDSDKGQQLRRNYDFIRADDPHVSEGSFQTDAITEIGGVKYVIAPKGTMGRLLETDRLAREQGIESVTQLTGGFGTAGRYSGFLTSPHQSKDHFRLIDAAVDFVSRDKSGRNITSQLNKMGVIRGAWGANAYVHGDGDGILGEHAHMSNYKSAEGQEAWDLYKKGTGHPEIVESMKKSIAVKEAEIKEYEKEASKDGIDLIEWSNMQKMISDKNLMKEDLRKFETEVNKHSLDLTGMRRVKDKLRSKPFRDLLDQQIQSQAGNI